MKTIIRLLLAFAAVLFLLMVLLLTRMREAPTEGVEVREIEAVRLASLPPPLETPENEPPPPPDEPPPPPPPPPPTPPEPELDIPPLPLDVELPPMDIVESDFPLINLPPPKEVVEPPPPPRSPPPPVVTPPPQPVRPISPPPVRVAPAPAPRPTYRPPPPAPRPAPPPSNAPVQASELDRKPQLLNRPSVRFPSRLSRRGVREGTVLLQVQIDPSGRVSVDNVIQSKVVEPPPPPRPASANPRRMASRCAPPSAGPWC